MRNQIEKTENFSCARADIAAYLDGELSPREEIDLEKHFAVCRRCEAEFNEQKKLLSALDLALDDRKGFELPADFTKKIVVRAESDITGLRRREERFRALFLCAAMFLLIILGLGSETEAVFATFAVFIEQFWAVAGFAAHLIFDIAVAVTAILRLVGGQFIYSPVFALSAFAVLVVSIVCVFARVWPAFDRSKI